MNTGFSHFSHDIDSKLQAQLRLERWIFFFTTPSVGMLLFLFLPHSKDTSIDWFSLVVSSLAWGAGMTLLTQLLTSLRFLRPRIKNQKNQPSDIIRQYPIDNVLRKTKHRLIGLSLCIGLLVMFTTLTFSSAAGPMGPSLFFGNLLIGVIGSAIIGSWSALIIDAIIGVYLGRTLIFKLKNGNPEWYSHQNSASHRFPKDSSLRSDWYNDVTNPASPVHKETYRHSDYP